jgi:hypothetical protein
MLIIHPLNAKNMKNIIISRKSVNNTIGFGAKSITNKQHTGKLM